MNKKKIIIQQAISNNFENAHFILYKLNNKGVKEVLYFKEVTRASKNNQPLNFFGVRTSKYGIRISQGATHWCLAILGNESADILVEDFIPEPMTKNQYQLDNNTYVHVNRYNKNLKFSIGLSQEELYNNRKISKKEKEELKKIASMLQ